MPYDVDAIRKKLKQTMSGKFSDPDEFRPEKVKDKPVHYRFFILPPFQAGEKLKTGIAKDSMESQFFVTHGDHWVQDKPYPCPRVWTGDKCPICEFGFQLLKDEKISKDDDKRRAVVKMWMPTQYHMMNIYFPADKKNPEDLHERVMFYNAPKTILDICTDTLMREDQGDPENPEAFGVFFDENNASLFEMQVVKQGKQNSYKTSKFLPTPRPMVRNQDGSPNEKAIQKLLASRHDLYAKIKLPDIEKINRVYAVMTNGDDSADDDKSGGFDSDETAKSKAKSTPAGKVDDGSETQVSRAATTTRKPPIAEDDVEPVKPAASKSKPPADDLADEAPLAEKPAVKNDAPKNQDIDNLLSQLDDED